MKDTVKDIFHSSLFVKKNENYLFSYFDFFFKLDFNFFVIRIPKGNAITFFRFMKTVYRYSDEGCFKFFLS